MRRLQKRATVQLADGAFLVVEVYGPSGDAPIVSVPGSPEAEIPASRIDECTAAILKTLAEGRRPLTSTKLFAAMEARGHIFGEATIRRRLAESVKSGDLLSGPEGYALPEWQKST